MCRGRISRTSEEGEKRIAGRSLYNGSITSSAVASSISETSMPSAFAVCRLRTNSNRTDG
jgi:hypothetical protein